MMLPLASAAEPSAMDAFLDWARIEGTWGMAIVIFGLVAQLTFFLRWVVQWIASERRGESHVPAAFWWLSLAGASMLLLYFIMRRDPIGILGQGFGWLIYTRNLALLRRAGK